MLSTERFVSHLAERGFGPYVGVPCSFLKPLINYIIDHDAGNYVAANNEGEAIAIASGACLAGRHPIVIFQNSGLGNTINPLTSLNHVFQIPLLLIITWRGQPGTSDEPQHHLMGEVTRSVLDAIHIDNDLFPEDDAELRTKVDAAINHMRRTGLPYAFIMRKGALAGYQLADPEDSETPGRFAGRELIVEPRGDRLMLRSEAVKLIADSVGQEALLVATTGKTARELAEYRDRPNNFYVIGSMGCASSVALGIAMHTPGRRIVVLDGDGAALMRLEAMVSIGHYLPKNLVHVVLDNESYESTGGQSTLSRSVDFCGIAIACGYRTAGSVISTQALERLLTQDTCETDGPHLIHLKIRQGSDPNLSRPSIPPWEVAARFRRASAENLAEPAKTRGIAWME